MKDKKNWWPQLFPALKKLLGAAIVIWFLWYLWENRSLISTIDNISILDLGLFCTLILASWFSASTQNYVLYRSIGAPISLTETYVLSLAATFGNYFPMRAGTILRAYYLNTFHSIDYAQFGSIFSIRLIIISITCGIVGTTSLLSTNTPLQNLTTLLIFFSAAIVIPISAYFWRPEQKARNSQNKLLIFLEKYAKTTVYFLRKPDISFICFILFLIQLALLAVRFKISAYLIGVSVPLDAIVILISIASLSSFLSITPGGIGVREFLMGAVSLLYGTEFNLGMLIGTVDRLALLGTTCIFGGISFIWVWVKTLKHQSNDQ